MVVVVKKKLAQGATTKELLTHQTTEKKPKPKNPFLIHSFAIAKENEQTLEHLKQDATDAIGRPISSSALLRAVVRFLAQQSPPWIATQLHPLIEEEIEQGRLWGTKGKQSTPSENFDSQTTPHTLEPGKVRKQKGKRT